MHLITSNIRNVIIIFLLAIGAVAAGFYLAPDHEEIALMQMNDAHFKDALKYYSSLRAKGNTSINVLVPLINLHVHYGDIDQSIELLKSFVTKHPRSIEGHKRLAALYKSSQRFNHYCKELEILQELAPSTNTLRDLADSYDFLGLYENEMQALARLVVSKDYKPREEDYVALASFLRVDHKPDEAVYAILTLIDLKKYAVSIETMHLAMQLLLETGEKQKAFSIAQKYLNKYGQEKDAITLSVLLQQQGQFDSAYALLVPFLPNISRSSDLLQQVITLQLAQGKDADAYALLSSQFNKGNFPYLLAAPLIDLAVKYKNYTQAEAVIHTVPLEKMPEDALLRCADQWFLLKRPDIALYMQSRLGKEYLRQDPLLEAVLDVAVHDTPEKMEALLAIPPESIALPEQKMIIAGICVERGFTERASALLNGMPVADILHTLDAQQYAQLYLDADEAEQAVALLNAARPGSPPETQARVDKTLLLLAAGEGKTESVQQWFKDHPDDNGPWLSEAYWLADRYQRDALALILAQRLYRSEPTPQNQMQLTEALLLNHRYAEALAELQPLAQKDPDARALYLEVMADWIHRAGIKEVPDANRRALEALVTSILKDNTVSLEEKRNMAYLLEKTGSRNKAENIFLAIAANQPFASPDVSELLGFWGDNLSPRALDWLEKRARNVSDDEKPEWLAYLNNTGHPQTVLAILGGSEEFSPPIADQYISALVTVHDTKLLNNALKQEIDKEEDPQRLKKLATIALQEDLPVTSEKGWRKLYSLDPDDADAEKELGLQALAVNHYTEAGRLLKKYLQHNKGDYQVNYAYAEVLQHKEATEQARPYFEKAQNQLAGISQKTIENQSDEAHLLYRNNKIGKSIVLYRKLLSQFPQNKTIRADFAELLIENQQFEEASRVLGQ